MVRSLHPRHSICGFGPAAEEILAGHEKCIRADGPGSPFDRLRLKDAAWILTLGCRPGFVSFLHWLEDFEPDRWPFPVHVSKPVTSLVLNRDNQQLEVKDWPIRPEVAARVCFSRIAEVLSAPSMDFHHYKGVGIGLYHMPSLAGELQLLLGKGIAHY